MKVHLILVIACALICIGANGAWAAIHTAGEDFFLGSTNDWHLPFLGEWCFVDKEEPYLLTNPSRVHNFYGIEIIYPENTQSFGENYRETGGKGFSYETNPSFTVGVSYKFSDQLVARTDVISSAAMVNSWTWGATYTIDMGEFTGGYARYRNLTGGYNTFNRFFGMFNLSGNIRMGPMATRYNAVSYYGLSTAYKLSNNGGIRFVYLLGHRKDTPEIISLRYYRNF